MLHTRILHIKVFCWRPSAPLLETSHKEHLPMLETHQETTWGRNSSQSLFNFWAYSESCCIFQVYIPTNDCTQHITSQLPWLHQAQECLAARSQISRPEQVSRDVQGPSYHVFIISICSSFVACHCVYPGIPSVEIPPWGSMITFLFGHFRFAALRFVGQLPSLRHSCWVLWPFSAALELHTKLIGVFWDARLTNEPAAVKMGKIMLKPTDQWTLASRVFSCVGLFWHSTSQAGLVQFKLSTFKLHWIFLAALHAFSAMSMSRYISMSSIAMSAVSITMATTAITAMSMRSMCTSISSMTCQVESCGFPWLYDTLICGFP